MQKLKKSQHKLILNELFIKSRNVEVKLVLDDQSQFTGRVIDVDIDDDKIILKTDTQDIHTCFGSLAEVYILK